MVRTRTAAFLFGGLVAATPAQAQSNAAQALQRTPGANPDRINEEQRERLQERVAPEAAAPRAPAVEAPPVATSAAGGAPQVRFILKQVRFDASGYFDQTELDAFAAPLIGHEVTLGELQAVVDRINAAYASRGITTARAALPPQQIQDGIVQIRLVEGRIGATAATGGSARSRSLAERRAGLEKGSLAEPDAVADRLRLFNLNNDAQLRARLNPGAAFGTTDVELIVTDPRRLSVDVFADNNGFESTGEDEIGAIVRGYRLFGDGDRASAVVLASRGVVSANGAYSVPFGNRVRASVSGSYGRTRVLFGPSAELGIVGRSYSFGGDLAGVVLATDRLTVTLTASLQRGLSDTSISDTDVIHNRTLTGTAGATVSFVGRRAQASVQGQVAAANVREALSGAEVTPVLFQGSALGAVALGSRFQARLRGDWQLSTQDDLPGVLQYQIGGSRTARSFSPGVAAGDRGLSASAELAYALTVHGARLEPFVFVDHAQTHVPGVDAGIESAGGGASATIGRHLQLRATGATSIGARGVRATSRGFFTVTLNL